MYDWDKDGFIAGEELEEFKEMLKNLGNKLSDEDVEEMINEVDVDGDGRISLEEFTNLMIHNWLYFTLIMLLLFNFD